MWCGVGHKALGVPREVCVCARPCCLSCTCVLPSLCPHVLTPSWCVTPALQDVELKRRAETIQLERAKSATKEQAVGRWV